jgi:Asp-tRNA(Asn)/Glu-tRNA(Gln) amidotransferase A subunit family amidase
MRKLLGIILDLDDSQREAFKALGKRLHQDPTDLIDRALDEFLQRHDVLIAPTKTPEPPHSNSSIRQDVRQR